MQKVADVCYFSKGGANLCEHYFSLDCAFYAVITKCDEITRKKYILQNIILRYGYLSAKYLYTSLMEILVHLKS